MPAHKQNSEWGPDLIKIAKAVSKLYVPLFGKELSLDNPEEKDILSTLSYELIHKYCEFLKNTEPEAFKEAKVDDMTASFIKFANKTRKTKIEQQIVNTLKEWIDSIDPYQFKRNTLKKAQNVANDMRKHLLYQKDTNTSHGGIFGLILIVIFIIIVIVFIAQ